MDGVPDDAFRPDSLPLRLSRRRDRSLSSPIDMRRHSRMSNPPLPSARFGRTAFGCRSPSPDDYTDHAETHGRNSTSSVLADPSGRCCLRWSGAPTNVLVVKKFHDKQITRCFKELVAYLDQKHLKVVVEEHVLNDQVIASDKDFAALFKKLVGWRPDGPDAEDILASVDLVICLGGDGTLLHVSSLFQESVPPVLAFHLGSLGFMTPLRFSSYQETIDRVLQADDDLDITLRSRLVCTINRSKKSKTPPPPPPAPVSPVPALAATTATKTAKGITTLAEKRACMKRRQSYITKGMKTERMLVLNEVVIDRGSSPYLSSLEMYCNDLLVTDVQGDGLIIATPTGSTAYAAAAGASMVHPSVQTMVVTPICPHSLSFRPIMVPGGVNMRVAIPRSSRGQGAVSCDGKNRQDLGRGDSVSITMCVWPLPCVNSMDHLADWFHSLSRCLSWNVRQKQKSFDSSDEGDATADDEDT